MLKALKKYSLYIQVLLLALIVIYAFFLRSDLYVQHNFNYFFDQARDLMLVKDIIVNGNITLIGARSGLGGIFHGPLWLYMITPFFVLAQGDPFWTLVPLILFISLATVVLGFFVGKKLYDPTTGIIFALLLAMSPSLIQANAIATNAQVMPLIFLLYIFALFKFLRGKDIYLVWAVLLLGLGIHFEAAFSVFLIPWTIAIVFVRKKFPGIKYVLLSIGVFLLTISTYIVFELRHQFLMTKAVLGLFKGEVKPLEGYEQYADLGFRIQDRLLLLKESYFSPLFQANIITIGLVFVFLLLFLGLLIIHKKRKEENKAIQREALLLFIFPVSYFTVYVLYPMPLWAHYILPLIITSALLLSLALRKMLTITHIWSKVVIAIFLVLITFPSFQWMQQSYVMHQVNTSGTYVDQLSAVQKVYGDAKSDFGYFAYYTGILTYNVDYLMWYEGKQHQYKAENTKKPITYLVLYPQPGGEKEAHTFWKKNTVRTQGKVLERWETGGGIVVEKLAISSDELGADPNYYQNLLFR